MLILARKRGETIRIDLMEDTNPLTPVGEIFGGGPIQILVLSVRGRQVKLGIQAGPGFRILRNELFEQLVS